MPPLNKKRWKPPLMPLALLTQHKIIDCTISFGDHEYTCYVMSRLMAPGLPGFVGLATFEGKRRFFISDEVLPEDRDDWILHEIREFETGCTCLESLKQELENVAERYGTNQEGFAGYVWRRLAFFERLVPYLEKNGDPRGSEFIREVTESRDHLRAAVCQLPVSQVAVN